MSTIYVPTALNNPTLEKACHSCVNKVTGHQHEVSTIWRLDPMCTRARHSAGDISLDIDHASHASSAL